MKKNKVLFMLGSYYDKPYANGICTRQIALEFKKRNFDVDILCYTNGKDISMRKKDDINIFFVRNLFSLRLVNYSKSLKKNIVGKIFEKVGFLIYRIKKVLFYPIFHVVSPVYYLKYLRASKRLMNERKYDIIVGVYNPVEAILSGMKIKNKNKDVKYIVYTLDTLTNVKKTANFFKGIEKKVGYQIEKKVYKSADLIVNMFCHKDYYSSQKYACYRKKMIILDIPLISINNKPNKHIDLINNGMINFIYSGAIPNNPSYYCDFFTKLNEKNNKVCLGFFGRGNWDSVINKYETITNGIIKNYGYIDHSDLMLLYHDVEGFICWEKTDTQMVSSKVLEYISTGKKIIYFYLNDNDVMLHYLKKYDNSLLINIRDIEDENINKTLNFIKKDNKIDLAKIRKDLKENTPEYSVNKMLEMIDYKNVKLEGEIKDEYF